MALSTVAAIIGQAQVQMASSWEFIPLLVALVLPIAGLTVALMRYQHLDSTKTREWTAKQFEKNNRETREWTAKQFDLLRVDIRGIGDSLNDARERLARIEGRLDPTHPQPDGNDGEDNRDAA